MSREYRPGMVHLNDAQKEALHEKISAGINAGRIIITLDFDDTMFINTRDPKTNHVEELEVNNYLVQFLAELLSAHGAQHFEFHILSSRPPDEDYKLKWPDLSISLIYRDGKSNLQLFLDELNKQLLILCNEIKIPPGNEIKIPPENIHCLGGKGCVWFFDVNNKNIFLDIDIRPTREILTGNTASREPSLFRTAFENDVRIRMRELQDAYPDKEIAAQIEERCPKYVYLMQLFEKLNPRSHFCVAIDDNQVELNGFKILQNILAILVQPQLKQPVLSRHNSSPNLDLEQEVSNKEAELAAKMHAKNHLEDLEFPTPTSTL